jgi:hypothetical protein
MTRHPGLLTAASPSSTCTFSMKNRTLRAHSAPLPPQGHDFLKVRVVAAVVCAVIVVVIIVIIIVVVVVVIQV